MDHSFNSIDISNANVCLTAVWTSHKIFNQTHTYTYIYKYVYISKEGMDVNLLIRYIFNAFTATFTG